MLRTPIALALFAAACAAPRSSHPAEVPPIDAQVASEWLWRLHGDWHVTEEPLEFDALGVQLDDEGQAADATGDQASGGEDDWQLLEQAFPIARSWMMLEVRSREGSVPFEGRLTVGHDSKAGGIVATWIDSIQQSMWHYTGTLDVDSDTLVLEADGPAMNDPSATTRYRYTIELVDADHRRATSSILAEDGAWIAYLRTDARRVSSD